MPAISLAEDGKRFSDRGDGTVLDLSTGIIWLKNPGGKERLLPIQMAAEYIREMNSGKHPNFGYTDWRLPTLSEMLTLVSKENKYPALVDGAPFDDIPADFYWTSTGGISSVGYAWILDMGVGVMKYDFASFCAFHRFWPVRSSPTYNKEAIEKLSGEAIVSVKRIPSELDFLQGEGSCVSAKDAERPDAPIGVRVMPMSSTELLVSWDVVNPEAPVKWFNVYEGDHMINSVSTKEATVRGVKPNTRKCFIVTAFGQGGLESEGSKEVCATTQSGASSGTVWTMGINNFGQLGDGTRLDRNTATPVEGVESIVKVAAGVEHVIALDKDGHVWVWGNNSHGQLGDGGKIGRTDPYMIKGLAGVTDIAAGWYHSLALTKSGEVYAWGRNYYGQLGTGTSVDTNVPVKVPGLKGVHSIAAGWYHSLALMDNGNVMQWGWAHKDVNDVATARVNTFRPYVVPGIENAIGIAGGMYHSAAVKNDGSVWTWGKNDYGQLGIGSLDSFSLPMMVKGLPRIKEVSCGMNYTIALGEDGSIWGWGRNDYGQIGLGDVIAITPVRIEGVPVSVRIAAGAHHAVAMAKDGSLMIWGWDYPNKTKNLPPKPLTLITYASDLAAGLHFTIIVKGSR